MVSGRAMRPLDVLRTRRGLTVEVGNTDAEGRLVLCDLLAEASDEKPALLLDAATLTGAARVALGPDLPALFCNDEGWAAALLEAGAAQHDPLWRLPFWRRLRLLAREPGRRPQQCGRQADGRGDRRGAVPATFRCARDELGASRRLCLERLDAARASRKAARPRRCGRCTRLLPPGSG